MRPILLAASLLSVALAAPLAEVDKRQVLVVGPTVQLPYATVVGSSGAGVDSFKGIPFASPPVGQLRLRPPQYPITGNLGIVDGTQEPRSCPQFLQQVDTSSLPAETVTELLNTPAAQAATNSGEDCLTVNVQRPSTAKEGDKLPVLFWIYGGGFEFGSTQSYDAANLILTSVLEGKPIIYVAVNYRLGGFGFLAGKKLKAEGSTNLGLLDQRAGLKWVADNIAKFGGDPSKVTIWGESAGSISVFDQMALYNGDNTYKGKPLFRAGIMNSGSIVPADPVDCPKAEVVFNTVVKNAGCDGAKDTLACLRSVDYTTFLNAGKFSCPLLPSRIRLNNTIQPTPSPTSSPTNPSPSPTSPAQTARPSPNPPTSSSNPANTPQSPSSSATKKTKVLSSP
jgi:carboxylesterase type B